MARLFKIGTQLLLLGTALSGSGTPILTTGNGGSGGVGVLPTLIDTTNVAVGTRTNTVVNKPTGTVEGKRIFVWISQSASGTAVTFSGTHGFTQIGQVNHNDGSSYNITQTLFTKICGASEPSSWTFEHSSRSTSAVCRSYNNADYYYMYPEWKGNSTQARILGVRNLIDNALRVSVLGRWDTGTTGTPSFMTEVYSNNQIKLYEGEIDAGDIPTKSFNNGNGSASPTTILSVAMASIVFPTSFYSESDYPNASNTGTSGTLTNSGSVTTTANGQVIQNLRINDGQIRVLHKNVTIRNCYINYSNYVWGIDGDYASNGNPEGMLVENCEFYAYSAQSNSAVLTNKDTEIRYCNAHGSSNGFMIGAGGANIHHSYVHDMDSTNADPHYDAIQGGGGWTGCTISNNRLESYDTSCILLQTEFGAYSNVTISNNLLMSVLSGVASFIYLRGSAPGTVGTCTVTNNVMTGSAYAGVADLTNGPTSLTWTGNIDQYGQLIEV